MKKVLSLVVSLVLFFSFGVVVYASENQTSNIEIKPVEAINIVVTGSCKMVLDQAIFMIRNKGTDDMGGDARYHVYRNDTEISSASYDLDSGEGMNVTVDDPGCDTIRVVAEVLDGLSVSNEVTCDFCNDNQNGTSNDNQNSTSNDNQNSTNSNSNSNQNVNTNTNTNTNSSQNNQNTNTNTNANTNGNVSSGSNSSTSGTSTSGSTSGSFVRVGTGIMGIVMTSVITTLGILYFRRQNRVN